MLLLKEDSPSFIQSSLYLQSLLNEGSWPIEGLEIPDGCAKKDLTVSNDTDLLELLTTIRYWLVPEVAEEVEDLPRYALAPPKPNNFAGIAADFATDIPFVGELLAFSLAEDKMGHACLSGKLAIVKMLCEELELPPTEAAGMSAAKVGHLACLKYLQSHGLVLTHKIHQCACEHGQLACLQFITECDSQWSEVAAMHAAKSGNVECIKYAIGMNETFSVARDAPALMEKVAEEGHLECAKILLEERNWPREMCMVYLMQGAVRGGHLEILKYGVANTYDRKMLEYVMQGATQAQNVDFMKYLHAQGCAYDSQMLIRAAMDGNLDAMKLLSALNIPWGGEESSGEADSHVFSPPPEPEPSFRGTLWK